jgi:hypothetical protein
MIPAQPSVKSLPHRGGIDFIEDATIVYCESWLSGALRRCFFCESRRLFSTRRRTDDLVGRVGLRGRGGDDASMSI